MVLSGEPSLVKIRVRSHFEGAAAMALGEGFGAFFEAPFLYVCLSKGRAGGGVGGGEGQGVIWVRLDKVVVGGSTGV